MHAMDLHTKESDTNFARLGRRRSIHSVHHDGDDLRVSYTYAVYGRGGECRVCGGDRLTWMIVSISLDSATWWPSRRRSTLRRAMASRWFKLSHARMRSMEKASQPRNESIWEGMAGIRCCPRSRFIISHSAFNSSLLLA